MTDSLEPASESNLQAPIEAELEIPQRVADLEDRIFESETKLRDKLQIDLEPMREQLESITSDDPDFQILDAAFLRLDGSTTADSVLADQGMEKYPLLRQVYDSNKDAIDSLVQMKRDVAELCTRDYDRLYNQVRDQVDYIASHVDYERVVDSEFSSQGDSRFISKLNDVSFVSATIHAFHDLDTSIDIHGEYVYLRMQRDKVEEIGKDVKDFIVETEIPEPSAEDASRAREAITLSHLKELGARYALHKEILHYTLPRDEPRSYDSTIPVIDHFSIYRAFTDDESNNGVPVVLSHNSRLQVEVSKRVLQEANAIPEYALTPTEGQVQQSQEYLNEKLSQAAKFQRLSEGYKGYVRTQQLTKNIPFSYVISYYEANGTIPTLSTFLYDVSQDALTVALSEELKLQEKSLKDKGVLKRTEREVYPDDVKTQALDAVIVIPPSEGLPCFSEDTLHNDVVTRLPGYMLEGLQAITFVEDSRVPTYQVPENFPYKDSVVLVAKKEFLSTLIHEIGEHAVFKLTLDELQSWETAIAEDGKNGVTAVSWYAKAKLLAATSEMDTYHAHKEDFCDSLGEFVTGGLDLYIKAPARFNFMLNYICSHLSPEDATYFRNAINSRTAEYEEHAVENSISKEAARAPLIAHETLKHEDLQLSAGTMVGQCIPTIDGNGNVTSEIKLYGSPYVKVVQAS